MHRNLFYYIAVIFLFYAGTPALAQHYQAINGSPMAGGLGVSNNPASIIHVPFAWDVTLFSFQEKHTTNALVVKNASYLGFKGSEAFAVNGNAKRFLLANQDIHLLNARIRLDSRQTIAFGANLRAAVSARTSLVNWQDTIQDLYSFLDNNRNHLPLSGEMRGTSWAEIFGTYARTLIDNGTSILNAGITVSVNRSLGGAYLTATNLNYFPAFAPGSPAYNVATGELHYAYSANIDDADNNGGNNVAQFMKRTFTSVSANLGIEYIIPADESESAYDYEWKIGVSAMDLGSNSHQYSRNSRFAVLNKQNISDSLIESAFKDANSIEDVNDSLAKLAGFIATPAGKFHIIQPARLVINADRHLQGHFFLNGQLTIPLTSVLSQNYLYVRDMDLLAVTPRYETRMFGAYLPFTFNMQKQLWVGGALRAGPLLLGIHNWANLFAKNKIQRGGFYLALTFRPGKKKDGDSETGRDAAGSHLSRRERRLLDCPPAIRN